jgi:hypothetical protein
LNPFSIGETFPNNNHQEGRTMSTSKTARAFLGLNAAFSAFTGAVLLFASSAVSEMIFIDATGWKPVILIALGVGLLIFAADLLSMATNRWVTREEVWIIVFADIGWIVISVFLMAVFGDLFTQDGVVVVAVVGLIVAVFAIGQYVGSRSIVPPAANVSIHSKNSALVAKVERAVKASPAAVWNVMTDHPGYADVAGNLSKVEVLSGDGLGMTRRCFGPRGENWTETCNHYEPGRSYGFKVHTEAPDYPYPLSDLQGRWSVIPKKSGSEFSIDIEAKPKGGFITRTLFSSVAKRKFKSVLMELAEAWAERMERDAKA